MWNYKWKGFRLDLQGITKGKGFTFMRDLRGITKGRVSDFMCMEQQREKVPGVIRYEITNGKVSGWICMEL